MRVTFAVALIVLAFYASGVARKWRRAGRTRGGVGLTNVLAFVAGWCVLVIAAAPGVDALAHTWLFAHMVQHLLLVTLAAPLLALGRPAIPFVEMVPSRWRRDALRMAHRILALAFIAWTAHTITLWAWHAPALYDAAVSRDALHALEHATLLGTALWFWSALVDATRRQRLGVAALWVFATALHSTLLGVLLVVAPRPWYPHYASAGDGVRALEDQQLAGLIMWVPAGVVLTGAGLALVAAWLREARRRVAGTRVERLRRTPAPGATALVLLAIAGALVGCNDARASAARMTGGDPGHGREALRAYGCWTCHTIPGVAGANGIVGPSLDGLAGRAFVAGQPNAPEHLVHFIRHPQAVRPATPMPDMGVTERDGRDIAAYLYTLR